MARSQTPGNRLQAQRLNDFAYNLAMALFIIIFVMAALSTRMFFQIPPGHGGVLYRLFEGGTVLDAPLGEGLHVIFPLNSIAVYELRIQSLTLETKVLSFNGLSVDVKVSCRFRPVRAELPLLHQESGPDYAARLITPTVSAAIREVVGSYRPEELYTTHRITLQDELDRVVRDNLKGRHLELMPILVERLSLPDIVNEAIEQKLRRQQEAQEYEFRIAREKQERERKTIEAEGISRYNEIVGEQLNASLLLWRGIQATENLAQSPNAKVVVTGGGSQSLGLPLIMGNLDADPSLTSGAKPRSRSGAAPSTFLDSEGGGSSPPFVLRPNNRTPAAPAASPTRPNDSTGAGGGLTPMPVP